MEHAQVTLPVEIPAARCGRRDEAGQTGHPRPALADAGGHGHLMMIARLVLRDWRCRPFVEIERVLRETPERLQVQFLFRKESREKLRVAPTIGKVRETEVAPRRNTPVTVAVVDGLDGRAVGPGEEFVE